MRCRLPFVCVVFVGCLSCGALRAAEFPAFEHKVIDPAIGKVCYAVAVADVDGDKKLDIVAVTENKVLWYQAPDWKKRVIIEDQTERDNVCIAAHDIDGDGKIDFALGAGWTKIGTIQWLTRGKSLDEKWTVHEIAREPWTHRMRFADVLGKGNPQLVVSPLQKTQGEGVRLLAFEIPKDPRTDRWPMTVMDQSLNMLHNHWHAASIGHGGTGTLTASREGVHYIFREGEQFNKEQSSKHPAGEVRIGGMKTSSLTGNFHATIEPMHGTTAAVYFSSFGGWHRTVLIDTLKRGHGLSTADLDGDGEDEIVVGHSDPSDGPVKGPAVYVFKCIDAKAGKWEKHLIDDGGVAVEDLICADLTGDGRIDIVAGGRQTGNLKLYVNRGPAK
ncbi:MAG: VCBS repeat-containing protein [Planctomycetales bacterium]